MTKRTWRGFWWDSENPDEKIPGTLFCSETGDLKLELVGGIDITIYEPLPSGNGMSVKDETREVKLIHGVSGNEKFTLMDNNCTHTVSDLFERQITQQDWSPTRALRGIHLEHVESAIFKRGHLRLERLLHWSNRSNFTLTIERREGEVPRSRRAERVPVDPIVTRHGDLAISLRLLSNDFRFDDKIVENERTLEAREWAILTVTPPTPASAKSFDEVQKDLQDLLTLCAYEPCGALNRSLAYETPDGQVKEVEVIGRQIYRTRAGRRSSDTRMLFSLADVEFQEIVPRWLELKSKARTGCNILFGLRYIERGYVGTRLLGVASAAESIHSSLRSSSTPITRSEYRRLKRKILNAISDENEYLIQFVNTGLHNNPTYNERMLELAAIPDSQAVSNLLGSPEQWATALRKSRNDLAHANERSAATDEVSQAFILLEVTYALLSLVLMSELGLSPEVQRRAVDENSRINYISRQFKNSLPLIN
ncbi:HEPN domain-containing protein [Streptomyces sp. NPDC088353]|uniref:ApeA N-terminal domain 1-containing protein n=1 Tax=Streptomyces sp. NPDC088353 TaxID=3365855 RepID=UPI0038164DF9